MKKYYHLHYNQGTIKKILSLRKGQTITLNFKYRNGDPPMRMKLQVVSKETVLK